MKRSETLAVLAALMATVATTNTSQAAPVSPGTKPEISADSVIKVQALAKTKVQQKITQPGNMRRMHVKDSGPTWVNFVQKQGGNRVLKTNPR
jgi:hypothetical protein